MTMRKNKRIFRPKRRYKIKRRSENAVKIITGVAAVAILVFVGYSAAGPVSRYLADRAEQTETKPWTPENTDVSADESIASEAPVSDAVQNTETSQAAESDAVQTEPSLSETVPAETAAAVSVELRSGGAAYTVSPEDLTDRASLEAALDEIRESGCSAVIFPMKTEGGFFYYDTDIDFVDTVIDGEDPVRSDLSAKDIAKAAEDRGLRPVALVSVLTDNNRYGDYRDGSYRSLDDSTWLDTSPEKGGKPWISPFDPVAQDYLCDIMTELGEAGFKEIIADDFIFPEFRSSDIELLGEDVSPYSDRYLALTQLAVMMTEAGEDSGAQVMLRITANSVIKGYSELFHPEELGGCTVLIDYSEDNIASTMVSGGEEVILSDMGEKDKVTAVFAEVTAQCGDMKTVPMLERNSMSADDFSEAVSALTAMGYEKYYVY